MVMATGVGVPSSSAFAAQVLELPHTSTPALSSGLPVDPVEPVDDDIPVERATPKAAPRKLPPMPAGLGSIDDYKNQGESESSYPAGYSAGAAPSSSMRAMGIDLNNPLNSPNGNRQTLRNEVMLGALVLGLMALEAHSAHQNRHR